MFEFFFTLTVAFLAYVAYDALTAVKRAARGEPILKPRPMAPARPVAAAAPVAAPKPAVKADVPAPSKPVKASRSKPAAKPDDAPAQKNAAVTLADQLRNPATGEVTAVPANYRFAKKWVKDALVSEKLLDRVYKPSELDAATAEKVRQAIDVLRSLPKYQG